jgi:hypothetical protein
MYLVCYKEKNVKRSLKHQIIQQLEGPVGHCELVFITDFVPTALLLTAGCEDGLPIFFHRRSFTKDPEYILTWYKFINIKYEDQCRCERECQRVVDEKKYRMSFFEMIASSLPAFTRPVFHYLLSMYVSKLSQFRIQYDEGEPMFCASMVTLVLTKVFPALKIEKYASSSDLLVTLLKGNMVKKMDRAPTLREVKNKSLASDEALDIRRAALHDYLS